MRKRTLKRVHGRLFKRKVCKRNQPSNIKKNKQEHFVAAHTMPHKENADSWVAQWIAQIKKLSIPSWESQRHMELQFGKTARSRTFDCLDSKKETQGRGKKQFPRNVPRRSGIHADRSQHSCTCSNYSAPGSCATAPRRTCDKGQPLNSQAAPTGSQSEDCGPCKAPAAASGAAAQSRSAMSCSSSSSISSAPHTLARTSDME